jgi:hypothetical protein
MLKYKDFNLNKPKILEGYTLEDPRGADDIFKPHLHHIEYDNILKKNPNYWKEIKDSINDIELIKKYYYLDDSSNFDLI